MDETSAPESFDGYSYSISQVENCTTCVYVTEYMIDGIVNRSINRVTDWLMEMNYDAGLYCKCSLYLTFSFILPTFDRGRVLLRYTLSKNSLFSTTWVISLRQKVFFPPQKTKAYVFYFYFESERLLFWQVGVIFFSPIIFSIRFRCGF